MLRDMGFATVEEMVPAPGLRVDLCALGPKGEIWVVECKSGRADFRSDRTWQGYLDVADRVVWADGYGAELLREGPEAPLAAARRKKMMLLFARHAALRLQALRDPAGGP